VVACRGSSVIFWAYASSLSGIKKKNGEYTFTDYAWEISTWPTILVFTKDFKEFVENIVSYDSKVLLSNTPIANTDSILPEIILNKISGRIVISVFDVSPVSNINAALLLHDPRYRTVENAKKFLGDIVDVFNDDKFLILFKVKRPLNHNSIFDDSYIHYIEYLNKTYDNILLCHGDISAEKIISLSRLCISIPFTSTAFIASMINVESIFYDGSGMVFSDDRNLQGVTLISGSKKLTEFKNSIFKLLPIPKTSCI
jgi:polysaccharide biosynthesis PFTS motif protein